MPTDRILIVEDEAPFAQVVEGYLRRLGYEVAGIANSGDDALQVAEQSGPDLALMDIEIRGTMDGIEAAAQIREKFDIPIIFLTGRSDDETLDRVRESKSFGYLLKPFRPEELKASLELAFIRHRHEAQLKRNELSISAAVKAADDAVILADKDFQITSMNPAAERLTGWSARRAVGQNLHEVFKLQGGRETYDALVRTSTKGGFIHETMLVTAAGAEVPVEVTISPVSEPVHGAVGSVLVFRDVTARKKHERTLRQTQAQLRSLASHLETAREAERTRIAREIHDEFGQILTGFKMDLAWLDKKLSAEQESPRIALQEKVRTMTELLGEMVQSVRRIATELRPGVLDDLGLVAAVEWQAQDFQKRTGIKALVESTLVDRPLPREISTALFRVFQESLTNVARHAEAKSVHVKLAEQGKKILLEVVDDGRGITELELSKPGAFGLVGMRERVIPLRGSCDISGIPNRGTRVAIAIPIEGAAELGNHD